MRNLFCLAALAAGLGQGQVSTPAAPRDQAVAALLADALLDSGDPRGAIAQAERAASMDGQGSEIRAGLALVAAQARSALVEAGEGPVNAEAALQAAHAWRAFWLEHPDHPAAEGLARSEEARLTRITGKPLPGPAGGDLLLRSQPLLAAGQPGAAVAQAQAALRVLKPPDAAEAQLTLARSLAADGRRTEAWPALA